MGVKAPTSPGSDAVHNGWHTSGLPEQPVVALALAATSLPLVVPTYSTFWDTTGVNISTFELPGSGMVAVFVSWATLAAVMVVSPGALPSNQAWPMNWVQSQAVHTSSSTMPMPDGAARPRPDPVISSPSA